MHGGINQSTKGFRIIPHGLNPLQGLHTDSLISRDEKNHGPGLMQVTLKETHCMKCAHGALQLDLHTRQELCVCRDLSFQLDYSLDGFTFDAIKLSRGVQNSIKVSEIIHSTSINTVACDGTHDGLIST